ncbi:3'-5' exonuclease [Specibacter cremeus]|uniref:3'-5' exonuclease n=1 Tax=Specibacter cremeus TaxID=1629051 RepID=UPI000F78C157|nr:3'-5' exonuclease [Specibacter cremeus]
MTSWTALPRAAFDLETTSRDPREARIVTASIVVVRGDGEVDDSFEWLADPGVEIPAETTEIHGISTGHARANGRPVGEVVAEVAGALDALFDNGIPVIAYNAAYDFTVMAHEAARHGASTPAPAPVIDPYICSKRVDRYRKGSRTLAALCEEYGVALDAAHTASADALAALRLADRLAERFGELRGSATDLHAAQIGWAREQAANFQEYLRRVKDPAAVIEGDWPVLPQPRP